MRFGLNDEEWEAFQDLVVNPLKKNGFRSWVFGSRARNTHRKFSDIDILIEPVTAASVLFSNTVISEVREKIENSSFPYKVDFVKVSDLAESYRASVMKDRIEL